MIELKVTDKNDIKLINQIIEVYKVKMFNSGMYIPKQIDRAIRHFQLDMSDFKE